MANMCFFFERVCVVGRIGVNASVYKCVKLQKGTGVTSVQSFPEVYERALLLAWPSPRRVWLEGCELLRLLFLIATKPLPAYPVPSGNEPVLSGHSVSPGNKPAVLGESLFHGNRLFYSFGWSLKAASGGVAGWPWGHCHTKTNAVRNDMRLYSREANCPV